MGSSELDFGIMCDGTEYEDWQAECIRNLREIESINLKLLIIDKNGSEENNGLIGKVSKIAEYRDRTTTRDAINKIAWWLYRQPFDSPPCKSRVDLSDELNGIDRVTCEVNEDGFSQYFQEDDIKRIREYGLDFILRMGFGIIRGEILETPKYGVWSFHHNDERKYRGGPPCFWEIYNGDPTTGAVLQRLTDRLDAGIILKRGFFDTKWSYHRNLNNVYYGTTEWPAQVALDILNGNDEYVNQPATKPDATIYRSPSPLQILSYNLQRGYSLGDAMLSGINHWNIGVIQDSIEESITERFDPEIEWYPFPRKDGYLADPFPVTIDDTTYVFVEDFSYTEWKGKISYIEYPSGFEGGNLRTAHEEPHHMSYPYLFQHNGTTYATPEIYQSGGIRLYEVHSPSDWEFKTTLVEDVDGVDPTVIKHNGRWWLFYTEQPYNDTKLYIRYADDLTGEWTPHQKNPVKTDIRSSRSGGTPFRTHTGLYRPAQNSVGGYGKKIVVNEIEKISPIQYIEEKVSEIKPSDDGPYTGMHTLSSRGNITLVDKKEEIVNRHGVQRRFDQIVSKLTP